MVHTLHRKNGTMRYEVIGHGDSLIKLAGLINCSQAGLEKDIESNDLVSFNDEGQTRERGCVCKPSLSVPKTEISASATVTCISS